MLRKTEEGYPYEEFIYCECECQKTLPKDNRKGRPPRRFYNGHNGRGILHYNYKGRTKTSHGYIKIVVPSYYCASPRGYVYEHRYVWEQYYNCCILPWIILHHKNGIKDDNRIENLQPMTQSEHAILHHTIDMSDRFCLICPAETTPKWYHYSNGFICKRCYERLNYHRKKKK